MCLFFSHFLDEVRQGGLSTELIQTGPNSRFPRNGENVAMSSLTICLAGNAQPCFGDAAGTFNALFGLNYKSEAPLPNLISLPQTIPRHAYQCPKLSLLKGPTSSCQSCDDDWILYLNVFDLQ